MRAMTKFMMLALLLNIVACAAVDKKNDPVKDPVTDPKKDPSTDTTTTTTTTTTATLPEVTAPSAAMLALLDTQCATRPEEMQVSGSSDGVDYDYTEVLVEQDQGDTLAGDGIGFEVMNQVGNIYVEPSTDGKVHWGARKWVLAKTKDDATKAMSDIVITSKITSEDVASIAVENPSEEFPKPQYEVCVVVQAPATLEHYLFVAVGNVISLNHEGDLLVSLFSGDVKIDHHGAGSVVIDNGLGDIDITSTANIADINISNISGDITVDDQGVGALSISNYEGDVTASAHTLSSVVIGVDSGDINFTLDGTGNILTSTDAEVENSLTTTSGDINVSLNSSAVLALSATTTAGDVTDQGVLEESPYSTALNGGTITLNMSSDAGDIKIVH